MARIIEGLVAGGLIAGVVWYTRRDRRQAAARAAAERTAALAEARAPTAATTADRAATRATAAQARADADSAQLDQRVAAERSPPGDAGLTRRFDALFARHGAGIPVPYLRALAHAESGLRPDDPLGLINVVAVALADYNRRHPEAPIAAAQRRDPAISIRLAADTLHQIAASYERHHGDLPNLRTRWSNPRFVELLTFGWNAGCSEQAGVGRVLRYLKQRPGAERPGEITLDTVFAAAPAAHASRHLSNPRKFRYSKGVVASFLREVARDARDPAPPTVA